MDHEFETQIKRLAQAFPYPTTPDVARQVRSELRAGQRQWRVSRSPAWAWVLALIVLAIAGLMTVPSVRAAVLEFIQIGAIRIFTEEEVPPLPTAEMSPTPSSVPVSETVQPIVESRPTQAPTPTSRNFEPQPLTSILELEGEMSLEAAREEASFPILLPTYPTDLGKPNKVFYQRLETGWGVFLVWFKPDEPEQIRLSLLILGPGAFASKGGPDIVEETTVNGERAVWMIGEHLLFLQTGGNQRDLVQLFVEGHVLVWEIDGITYRLESELSMEETIRIAESIK